MDSKEDCNELKRAMRWYENGPLRYVETYHFERSLIPLLELSFNDTSKRFYPTTKPYQPLYRCTP